MAQRFDAPVDRASSSATPIADAALNPATKYLLMAGRWAPCRVRGWVSAKMPVHPDSDHEAAWTLHHAALVAEAEAAGFIPHRVSGEEPEGPGFEAWRAAFLKQYSY